VVLMKRFSLAVAAFAVLALSVLAEGTITLPPFELPTLTGGTISDLELQGRTLLFFTIPECEACSSALELVKLAVGDFPWLTVALVVPEETEETRGMVKEAAIDWPVIVDESFLLASVFGIGRVPTACLLQDGTFVGRLERGFTEEDLASALAGPFGNIEVTPEDESTASASGVAFMALQGPLLLMFAGADCGYCHHMLPSVFGIAESFDTCAIITEELDDREPFESEAERLSILLDPNWELARLFDVPTVPTVFFIDRDGTILWSHTGIVEGLSIVASTILQRTSSE